jgi:hypothetical protein
MSFKKVKVVDIEKKMDNVHRYGLDDDMYEGVLEDLKEMQELYNRLLEHKEKS